jgi:GNAT superfamily N-acetyltransferase
MLKMVDKPERFKSLKNEIGSDWGYAEDKAADAVKGIWYDVYLYTKRTVAGELVAIATAELDEDGGVLEILNAAVKSRRQGIGTEMARAFIDLAEENGWWLKLLAASDAVGFWEKVGFEIDECYYGDEPLGVLMWKRV